MDGLSRLTRPSAERASVGGRVYRYVRRRPAASIAISPGFSDVLVLATFSTQPVGVERTNWGRVKALYR
jgi:hypothetical protein